MFTHYYYIWSLQNTSYIVWLKKKMLSAAKCSKSVLCVVSVSHLVPCRLLHKCLVVRTTRFIDRIILITLHIFFLLLHHVTSFSHIHSVISSLLHPQRKHVADCPTYTVCIRVRFRTADTNRSFIRKFSGDNSFITTWLLRKCPNILVLLISHSFLEFLG